MNPLQNRRFTRRFRTGTSFAALTLLLLSGCGGHGSRAAANAAVTTPDDLQSRSDSWPSGRYRFVQSVFFGSLDPGVANKVGDTMKSNQAAGTTAGIAFAATSTYGGSSPWTNAINQMKKFDDGKFVLYVEFGHLSMPASGTSCADDFYNNVFATYGQKAYFLVSPANEYSGSNFEGAMTDFTNELVKKWKAANPGKSFPTGRVHLCKYGMTGQTTLNGFTVEGEYHLGARDATYGHPATSLPTSYRLVSNDGQSIWPFRAYNAGAPTFGDLDIIDANKYNTLCHGLSASIWLPPFHRWAYDSSDGKYKPNNREDPSGSHLTDVLNAVASFMKSS